MPRADQADIICIACSRTLGAVERRDNRLALVRTERPILLRLVSGRPVCVHCGGRGFVERALPMAL
jgi:hypothetical protein